MRGVTTYIAELGSEKLRYIIWVTWNGIPVITVLKTSHFDSLENSSVTEFITVGKPVCVKVDPFVEFFIHFYTDSVWWFCQNFGRLWIMK